MSRIRRDLIAELLDAAGRAVEDHYRHVPMHRYTPVLTVDVPGRLAAGCPECELAVQVERVREALAVADGPVLLPAIRRTA